MPLLKPEVRLKIPAVAKRKVDRMAKQCSQLGIDLAALEIDEVLLWIEVSSKIQKKSKNFAGHTLHAYLVNGIAKAVSDFQNAHNVSLSEFISDE